MLIFRRASRGARGQRGFTLIELVIVVAIIGILATIAMALYGQVQTRARVAKVQGDLRAVATAVSIFQTHVGTLPAALSDLTSTASNMMGQVAGPFLAAVPSPPASGSPAWSDYESGYVSNGDGSFTLSASGDNTTVTVP
jgi:type IV pilus assembly protein PilA